MANSIVLIGPPGSGKTTCGQSLAQKLGWNFFDIDTLIEMQESMTVPEIFRRHGEGHFRKLESQALKNLADSFGEEFQTGSVIACGGGTAASPDNFALLSTLGTIVCLNASLEKLSERVSLEDCRPLIGHGENREGESGIRSRLSALLELRKEAYQMAPYQVDTSKLTTAEVTDEIIKMLAL